MNHTTRLRPICLIAAALACAVVSAHAQILPRDKRAAVLKLAKDLETIPEDDFETRLAQVKSPFIGAVLPPVPGEAPDESANELIALLQKELKISGVGQLGSRKLVFINGRRFSVGDSATFKLGGAERVLKLISFGNKSITVDVGGREVVLPTR